MKWRLAEEKLPPNEQIVLIWDEDLGIRLSCYMKVIKRWMTGKKLEPRPPTHWQPLPKTPDTEETDD